MDRQLLPPLSVYLAPAGVKESKEDFSWHEDCSEFENVRQALDMVGGSREWLKDFTGSFYDEEAAELISHMNISQHSGASLNILLRMYSLLLGDWDGWVLAQKTRKLKDEYNAKQVSWDEVKTVILQRTTSNFKAKYNLEMTDDELLDKLMLLNTEYKTAYDADCQRYEDERDTERLSVLEHHFKYPSRWLDSASGSHLIGHPSSIEHKHLVEMEKRHPGYQEHLMGIIKQLHSKN